MLKTNPNILRENVPFNMEADSLNCIVLGDDVTPDRPEWEIFIKEVRKEMTLKAGQRCTGIRRIFVPENKMEDLWKTIAKSLAQTTIGNPLNEKVRMGSLAGETQRKEVREQVQKLLASSQIVYGSLDSVEVVDADSKKGAFLSPVLLMNEKPHDAKEAHDHKETKTGTTEEKETTFEIIPVAKGTTEVGYTQITLLKEIPKDAKIVVKGAFFVMAKMTNAGEGEHGH